MNHSSNVLVIDIGNTRAKFGVFHVDPDHTAVPIAIVARVINQVPSVARELMAWWKGLQLPAPMMAIVAGSDPETRDQLINTWPLEECRPAAVVSYQQIPITVDVDFPAKVGIDRLLNVFAAGQIPAQDRSVIVVDSGTATTVDLMTSDQTFRGGSILPGLRLSACAMHDYTARLPLLNVDDEPAELPDIPGRNTEDAMRAGLFIGQLGAVRELVNRLTAAAAHQFRESDPPRVVVTGGGGRQLVRHLAGAAYIDSLALHGLALLFKSPS